MEGWDDDGGLRERPPGAPPDLTTDRAALRDPGRASSLVLRKSLPRTTRELQRSASAAAAPSPDAIHDAAAAGTATPTGELPHRADLEAAFGRDLSDVEAHTGPDAQQSAAAMGAEAYATGDHVVAPADASLFLVAHEVTHVLQQRDGVQLAGGIDGGAGDPYEREADDVAGAVVRGESVAHRFGKGARGGAGVQRKAPRDAKAPPAAAVDPETRRRKELLAAALPSITTRWKLTGGQLFTETDTPVSLPPPMFAQTAYGLIVQDQADLAPVQSALEGPNREEYAQAFAEATTAFRGDRPRLEMIKKDVDDICAGGDVPFNANRVMASQALLTPMGKRALASMGSLGTSALTEYIASQANAHGELDRPNGGGAVRVRGCEGVLATLRTGAPYVAPQAGAEPGKDAVAPVAPEVQQKIDALRAAVTTAIAQARKATGGSLGLPDLTALNTAIEVAGIEARDRVWADKALVGQLVQVLDAGQAKGLIEKLDPVDRLYKDCGGKLAGDEDQEQVRALELSALPPDYRARQRERIKLTAGGGVFQTLRAWLLVHAADEALRRRLLSHTKLKDDFIDRLAAADQRVIYRLIIRGTEQPTAEDVVIESAEQKDGAGVVRGLRALAGSDPKRLADLEGDMIFRKAVEPMTELIDVDGQPIRPYHLCLAMWGRPVGGAADPGTVALTEVDPTGDDRPLTVVDRMKLNHELFDAALKELNDEITGKNLKDYERRTAEMYGRLGNPQKVMDTLVKYDRLAAQDPYKTLLQREKLVFGRELEERYFRTYNQPLRTWIYEHSGPNNRSGANRVLGTEQGSSVGMFNGEMMLAGETVREGKMSLTQALREHVYEGRPIYEWASVESREVSRAMDDADKDRILKHWESFRTAVDACAADLTKATDIKIRAIDLMRNAYMEHGGHFETRLAIKFKEPKLGEIRAAMGLTADVDRVEGGPPASIEDQAEQRFAEPSKTLWSALQGLNRSSQAPDYVAVRVLLDCFTILPRITDEAKPPATFATGHDVEERPPRSFDAYYRIQYGASPKLHAAAMLRAMDKDRALDAASAAKLMGLDEALVTQPLAADKADDGSIGPHNRHLVRASFSEENAKANAKEIWTILHVSDGKLSLIEAELYGPYNDEEQRLIRVAFRRLSGGFDLTFYIRQAMEVQQAIKNGHSTSDTLAAIGGMGASADYLRAERSKTQEIRVGAEGSQQGQDAMFLGGGTVVTHGSESELDRALAVATTGGIDARTRLWNAVKREEDGQIVHIIDELTPDERRKVLHDGALVDRIERQLSQYDYERAFKVLTGQADLADRLYSRSHGGSWSERHLTGGTDESGMRNDIKSYARRLRLQYDREVRQEVAAKFGPNDPPPPPEVIEREINRRVVDACRSILSDKDVTAIMNHELDSDEYAEMRSMIANAGDARDWAVAGGGGKDKILAEIRAMKADERKAKLSDPSYLRLLGERLPDEKDYRDAMNALAASADGVDDGGGGLAKLDEKSRTSDQVEGGKRDARATLDALAALSAAEYQRLQDDPAMMVQVMGALENDEQRALARQMLSYRFPQVKGTDEEKAAQADQAQIDYVVHQSVMRMRMACRTSNKWSGVLEQAVEVFKAELPDSRTKDKGNVRDAIWRQIEKDVRGFAQEHDDHPGAVTSDKISGAEMIAIVKDAVLHVADPSDALINAKIWTVEEQLGNDTDPMRRAMTDHRYKEEDLINVLEHASDEHLIKEWTSVVAEPVGGGPTMQQEYTEYRAAVSRAQPVIKAREQQAEAAAAPPAEAPAQVPAEGVPAEETTPAWYKELHRLGGSGDPALDEAEVQRQQFLEFAIHVSAALEKMLKPYMGDGRELTERHDPNTPQTSVSRNKRYNNLAEVIYGRIPSLKAEKIADAIGVAPEDRWLLLTAARTETGMFVMRTQKNLRSRGASTSERSTASGEKEELDTSRILYGRAMALAMTDGTIDSGERAQLQHLGDENDRARDAYKTALETAAMWASLIVGTLVTIVATILTGGLALGPVAMMAIGAATAALSATAKSMVNKEILDNEWDSKDTSELIAKEVITGIVTMGTTYYAQKLLTAVGSVGTIAKQANAARGVLRTPPPLWKVFLNEASEEVTSEAMSGVVEAGLEATDPNHWIDGYREGSKEARAAGMARLAQVPGDALRGGITSLLTAGVGHVLKRGGHGGADLGDMTKQQRKVSLSRNIKKVFGDPEEKISGALVEWAMNQSDPIDWSAAPGELLQGVISEYGEASTEMHTGTASAASRKRNVDKHLAIWGHELNSNEEHDFRSMHEGASSTDAFVTVKDYARVRTEVAMTGLSGWEAKHGPLTPAQRDAFVKWVRQAQTADELSARAKHDPLSLPEVRSAAAPGVGEHDARMMPAVTDAQIAAAERPTQQMPAVREQDLPAAERRTQQMPAVTEQQGQLDASQRVTQQMPAVDPNAQQTAARDVRGDFASLHDSAVSEDALGAHQRGQAEAALTHLSPQDYVSFQALHNYMPTPTGRGFLLKALAAGHSMADIQWLAGHMAGKNDAWLLDNLTLHDPRGVGAGITQQHAMGCNSSMTMAAQGAYDPVFALGLRISNPNISQVDAWDPTRFNTDLAARERAMLESGYQGQNALGAPGWGGQATPIAYGAARGRWADDLLNSLVGRFGIQFTPDVGLRPADAVQSLDEGLSQGLHVPVVIGSHPTDRAHYVLATGRRDGPNGPEYRFHNTANGQSVWVSVSQILTGQMPLLGGIMITSIERPQAMGAIGHGGPPAGGAAGAAGAPTLTPAAAPQLATLAMQAVTQQVPITVAATAIAIEAGAPTVGPDASAREAGAPEATTASARATLIMPAVQEAVAQVVHPQAVAAAALLSQQQSARGRTGDAQRDQFSDQWTGRQVSTADFRAKYDFEYEDAVDKINRSKAKPEVAAVLDRVPEEELVAIILYTSSHFVEMNRTLRQGDTSSLDEHGDAIHLADKGLDKLPSYQGWVHRGVDSLPAEVLAKYVPGQTVTEHSFTSTSYDDGAQFAGNVQFKIKSKDGKLVESLSRYDTEKEVLFRPGATFKVLDKERDGDRIVITMEEVSGGGPGGPGGPGGAPSLQDHAFVKEVRDGLTADEIKQLDRMLLGKTTEAELRAVLGHDVEAARDLLRRKAATVATLSEFLGGTTAVRSVETHELNDTAHKTERQAANLEAARSSELAHPAPLTSDSIIVDNNVIASVRLLMNGTKWDDLQPRQQAAINGLRQAGGLQPLTADPPSLDVEAIIGTPDLRVPNAVIAESGPTSPDLPKSSFALSVPSRDDPKYVGLLDELAREPAIGKGAGHNDRSVVADALFSAPAGAKPTFVTADERVYVALADKYLQNATYTQQRRKDGTTEGKGEAIFRTFGKTGFDVLVPDGHGNTYELHVIPARESSP